MKKLLIISPYFPPSNAADMQRVRMSLGYFNEFGWDTELVCVSPGHSDINKDPLLSESIPESTKVHYVGAFSKKLTSRLGLGSIALRSLWFYKQEVDSLLKDQQFDLIYFSTTQFPVCILGAYWKRKFNIPYVIDMQDPWHSDYYKDKPKNERPPKYWFSYRLNKYLEPIAMQKVGGLISVSDAYITTLKSRYKELKDVPAATITFGAFEKDQQIVKAHTELRPAFKTGNDMLNLVYIGRGGHDMQKALTVLFTAFKTGLAESPELFNGFRFHFIGTSYASKGTGKKTILPIAEGMGTGGYVSEQTDRIPFYQGLKSLQAADGLIVPGSDAPAYTASKLYPYILARKPLLGIFHPESSASSILKKCNSGQTITLDATLVEAYDELYRFLQNVKGNIIPRTDWHAFEPYTAKEMTRKQCEIFDKVLLGQQDPERNAAFPQPKPD